MLHTGFSWLMTGCVRDALAAGSYQFVCLFVFTLKHYIILIILEREQPALFLEKRHSPCFPNLFTVEAYEVVWNKEHLCLSLQTEQEVRRLYKCSTNLVPSWTLVLED